MTVKELIEFLNYCDPDAKVKIDWGNTWDYVGDAEQNANGVFIIAGEISD